MLVPPARRLDRLRAQRRARGAAGPPAGRCVWAEEERAARAPRAAGAHGVPAGRGPRARAALRLAATTRASSPRSEPYPYADAGGLLAAEDALVVALDQVQDPQNLGAICRSAEGAGAAGVVIPERARRRGDAGGLPGLGGRGRAPARSRACATSPTSSRRPSEMGAWVYGADAGAPAPIRRRTTRPRRDRARLGGDGACARACGRPATSCRAPAARAGRVAERVAPPRRAAVRGCEVSAATVQGLLTSRTVTPLQCRAT